MADAPRCGYAECASRPRVRTVTRSAPLQPLASLMARRQEYEADEFAATHASAASLASALAKLYRDNAATLTPDPLHSLVYDSHPPAALRIDHLRRADPVKGMATE